MNLFFRKNGSGLWWVKNKTSGLNLSDKCIESEWILIKKGELYFRDAKISPKWDVFSLVVCITLKLPSKPLVFAFLLHFVVVLVLRLCWGSKTKCSMKLDVREEVMLYSNNAFFIVSRILWGSSYTSSSRISFFCISFLWLTTAHMLRFALHFHLVLSKLGGDHLALLHAWNRLRAEAVDKRTDAWAELTCI